MLFSLFVRNADMPAGLRFLQNLMNVQSSIGKLRFALGMGEAHNFNYSMNSLRSYSISYLVTQPKVETRYNQKNLHAFQPFRAECRHACRIKFLADFL